MGNEGLGRRSNAVRARWVAVALASLCGVSGAAAAQEIEQFWVSDLALNGPHRTERAVQQDMESQFAFAQPYGPYSFEVTGQRVLDNRTVYDYEFERVPPLVGDWSYKGTYDAQTTPVASQQAVVDLIKQRLDAQSVNQGCPASTTVTVSPNWQAQNAWDNGQSLHELTAYTATYSAGTPGNCNNTNEQATLQRSRTIQCPNTLVLAWRSDKQACAGAPGYAMTYASAPVRMCPNEEDCQPGSGNKTEATLDFDLGWISFQRRYNSTGSAAGGGFGMGWTHSHNLRLTIGTDPLSGNSTLHYGLIDGNGVHTPFKPVGSVYEAADGSGDRLVANGAQWTLYQADRVLSFDSDGRLLQQRYDDGTALTYTYDTWRRLSGIGHSSGRSLTIAYTADRGGSPIASIASAGATLTSYAYTSAGQVETATYAGGALLRYHYGSSNVPTGLTGVTAEDNRRLSTYDYDSKARVAYTLRGGLPTGDSTVMDYLSTGAATVTNPLDRTNTYTFTAAPPSGAPKKVASVANTAGTLTYTYYPENTDFRRRIDTVTDRNGTVAKHTYAELTDTPSGLAARSHTVVEAQGTAQARTTEQRVELATNRALMTLVGNRETRIARNARQQPTSVTVRDTVTNATRTTTYAYCEAADVAASNSTCPLLGLPKSVDGPRTDVSDVTTYAYYGSDAAGCASSPSTCTYRKGDLWKTTNALGQITEVLQYDAQGRALSVIGIDGVVTDYEYHPRGWLTATKVRGPNNSSESDDRITTVAYYPTGLVQRLTQPDGSYVQFTYDAAQRLTDVADNAGNGIHYTLNAAGQRTQEDTKDSGGTLRRRLARDFNALGQQTQHKDASNNITGTTYDADGNPNMVTDPLSRAVDSDYDALNRLVRTLQDPGGIAAETLYQYDALDNVTQVTDPKGLNTAYAYNGFGEVTQLTSPDTGVTAYTFDSAGNLGSRLDGNDAQAHTYDYDALNRLTSVSMLATSGGNDVVYQYDTINTGCGGDAAHALGRMTGANKSGTAMRYCYDRFGQVETKMQIVGGRFFMVNYTYTAAGHLQSINYPDGALVDYVRNAQGRITEVGVTPAGGSRTVLLNQAGYAPFGPALGWVYGNGRSLARSHDLDYRPSTVYDSATGGLSLHYGYDTASQLTELKDGLQSAFLARYDYDNLGRLTVLRDGPSNTPIETYGYDATGNRTSLLHSGVTTSFTYPSTSHRLSSAGGVARTYDGVGNTLTIGGTTKQFNYGEDDRMRSVQSGSTIVRSYAHNALGERVLSTIPAVTGNPDGSGGTPAVHTYTVYDESGRWLGDYDTNGAVLQQAIWLDDLPVGLLAGAGAQQKLHYIEPDHLGTPRAVIDRTRNLAIWTWALQGEAFGNSPPNQDPDLDGTNFVFDMRFPGQRYDAATGLNYNYFRDYDAGSGRYVQSDPIGLEDGVSTYSYVGGDPLGDTDPSGLNRARVASAPSSSVGAYTFQVRLMIREVQQYNPSFRYHTVGSRTPGYGRHDFNAMSRILQQYRNEYQARYGNSCGRNEAFPRGPYSPYSMPYETSVPNTGSGSRRTHNRDANAQLEQAMRSNPEFARMMEMLGVRLPRNSGSSPDGWSWHHKPGSPGVMQLVPRYQHTGSQWQPNLHPNGVGGYYEWGNAW
ncbi:RHS repeat-associated core domain-containing protein [Lysobacter silvisoli]|uniref:RHS repeat protein n=1 Tax=Lysobacter silvisoli TaxID=2293254 RepID=A0A371K291_9GAMM|nr:RHS repeat-associated core domain-containing protein [Lysobacter silvisoli]RDZ28043.1 RHS repeat protein [Lysobacter silvisoli]